PTTRQSPRSPPNIMTSGNAMIASYTTPLDVTARVRRGCRLSGGWPGRHRSWVSQELAPMPKIW
ncbi:hypothetical protein ACIA8K_19295, partial [Catenuloplanes sp. NPDC051500]|uniref:hypothetical protein n=1 Tax=Catenuloplanes sp. NPDC051500 TaxID=3363959 RepID=UPI00379F98DE